MSFPDELSDRVAQLEPYRQHTVQRTRLEQDMVFHAEGREVMLECVPVNAASLTSGVAGRLMVFVDPDVTPAPTVPGGPSSPGERRFGPPPNAVSGPEPRAGS